MHKSINFHSAYKHDNKTLGKQLTRY